MNFSSQGEKNQTEERRGNEMTGEERRRKEPKDFRGEEEGEEGSLANVRTN